MFGQPEWSLRHKEVKYIYTKGMNEGTSVTEHVLGMMMHFNIAEVNGGAIDEANHKGKWKTPKQNKGKKTAEKGKCYHCGEDGHWLRNCPKYLAQKKSREGNTRIERLVESGLLSQLEDNSLPPCDSCLEEKTTKRSFTGKGLRAKTSLELVHSDLCRPIDVKARGGYEYFISFIDDYSRYGHVYLIQNKFDSFEKLKEHKAEVENESGKIIKTLRSDQGGEYLDLRFQDYLIEHGIQSQLSAPSTLQQNGVSERRNRTLLDMVRFMMSFAQFSVSF
ncbi:gag/pol protein [Cucumis melo var. makuwa]|uniref:Gag/pol protein n=1 Tax=Cucumis melo var. makuwa TaxID=1194695 RepID=A0A5D3DSV3_CUCMM|nr:gag/pol protein [Cucumis melo var. makuwa]TYK26542.1 gag/pol protein [Cucumis melo var. makuwa]